MFRSVAVLLLPWSTSPMASASSPTGTSTPTPLDSGDDIYLCAPSLETLLSYGFDEGSDALSSNLSVWRNYCNTIVGEESSRQVFGKAFAREVVVAITQALVGVFPHVRCTEAGQLSSLM